METLTWEERVGLLGALIYIPAIIVVLIYLANANPK